MDPKEAHAMKTLDDLGKDFGAFYPRGHMVVSFETDQNAKAVLEDLRAQDPLFREVMIVTPQEMVNFAQANIAQAGVIANMGTSLSTVQHFLDAARTGAHFLVIPTPDDAAAATATQAINRVPHVLAERYHLLAIEDVP
jgi:hypothetical protein